jgi:hypothetical protein
MATEHKRTSTQHTERDHTGDDQNVIDEVGKEGTVRTSGGETSLGTTPIGTGSVEPVGGHREASDRIMGEQSADDGADRDHADHKTR